MDKVKIIIASVLWGIVGLFAQLLFALGLKTNQIAGLRFCFSAIIMAIILLFKDIKLLFGTVLAVFKGGSSEGANSGTGKKREYYYADELLKSGKISKEQYDLGMSRSEELCRTTKKVDYSEDLHNK